MASFIRLILQSQRRWKDTARFRLYKGTRTHFRVAINSNHPLPIPKAPVALRRHFFFLSDCQKYYIQPTASKPHMDTAEYFHCCQKARKRHCQLDNNVVIASIHYCVHDMTRYSISWSSVKWKVITVHWFVI